MPRRPRSARVPALADRPRSDRAAGGRLGGGLRSGRSVHPAGGDVRDAQGARLRPRDRQAHRGGLPGAARALFGRSRQDPEAHRRAGSGDGRRAIRLTGVMVSPAPGPGPHGRREEPSASPAIQAEDLVKDYGFRRVLDGVSLSVPQGTFCTLFGPNGAGKTTLVKILTTLSRPTSGTVRIAGLPVRGAE